MAPVIVLYRPLCEFSLAVSVPYHQQISVNFKEMESFDAIKFFVSCKELEKDAEKTANLERVISILKYAHTLGGNVIEIASTLSRLRLTINFYSYQAMSEFENNIALVTD